MGPVVHLLKKPNHLIALTVIVDAYFIHKVIIWIDSKRS